MLLLKRTLEYNSVVLKCSISIQWILLSPLESSLKNLSMSNLITWPNGKENGDTLIFARDHTVSR